MHLLSLELFIDRLADHLIVDCVADFLEQHFLSLPALSLFATPSLLGSLPPHLGCQAPNMPSPQHGIRMPYKITLEVCRDLLEQDFHQRLLCFFWWEPFFSRTELKTGEEGWRRVALESSAILE
ncbi:uncharacterized protein LOC109723094 [Ananas comosus]|uniref:Uncharacterized protein LOC109723094 n=1 Tax=Ananas comosus TaxID=4615 RepID=A0A6P5GNE6_ANACO|nr:uncharacterized protein LOC109723094 [Ananas comosus]